MNEDTTGTTLTMVSDSPRHFAIPDRQWVSKRCRPTSGNSRKNRPAAPKPTWGQPKDLLPESMREFVDKHAIKVLGENEQGQAFLRQLKDNVPQ